MVLRGDLQKLPPRVDQVNGDRRKARALSAERINVLGRTGCQACSSMAYPSPRTNHRLPTTRKPIRVRCSCSGPSASAAKLRKATLPQGPDPASAEHSFDLLVIGRHGEGGLIHPKLGHIAESAARGCKIPVLLVSAS